MDSRWSRKPVRLYTMGPMFRYERPQAGRYRQFHQANVEALGETHPALDAEVIAMLMDFFGALGWPTVSSYTSTRSGMRERGPSMLRGSSSTSALTGRSFAANARRG